MAYSSINFMNVDKLLTDEEIMVRDTVRDLLSDMAKAHTNPLARLHALWTLEGCESITNAHLLLLQEIKHQQPAWMRHGFGDLRSGFARGDVPVSGL